jgi:hypothetical protein
MEHPVAEMPRRLGRPAVVGKASRQGPAAAERWDERRAAPPSPDALAAAALVPQDPEFQVIARPARRSAQPEQFQVRSSHGLAPRAENRPEAAALVRRALARAAERMEQALVLAVLDARACPGLPCSARAQPREPE